MRILPSADIDRINKVRVKSLSNIFFCAAFRIQYKNQMQDSFTYFPAIIQTSVSFPSAQRMVTERFFVGAKPPLPLYLAK